ncbi:hypothetical protein AB0G05_36870 [Nonomuraea wenchangensis]
MQVDIEVFNRCPPALSPAVRAEQARWRASSSCTTAASASWRSRKALTELIDALVGLSLAAGAVQPRGRVAAGDQVVTVTQGAVRTFVCDYLA